MNEKRDCRGAAILLAGAALLVLFAGAGFREIESGDETRVAGIAAEMFLTGNFLVPQLNGGPFLEYPPLYYWMVAGAYSVFGICDFAAKFPSLIAAFGMVLLTFAFARKLKFSSPESFCSGIVLLFSAQFFAESRTCRVDMLLAFFIELSLFSFYAMVKPGDSRSGAGYRLLFVLGLAGGIYTKGLIGLVLPGAVIGFWLAASDVLAREFRWKRYAALLAGCVLAFSLAWIWYGLLWDMKGYAVFHTAFWVNNFGRFTGSQPDHAGGFAYYFTKLPSLFQPWLLFVLFALTVEFRRICRTENRELLLPALAVLVPFALLCCASGKRIVYLLPLSAPSALLTGWCLWHLPGAARPYRNIFLRRRTGGIFLLIVIAATIGVDIAAALYGNRKGSLRPMFEYCAGLEKQGRKLFLVDPPERTRGAAYFYLHHGLPEKRSVSGAPGRNECWIVRRKQNGGSGHVYADHHSLLESPVFPQK